MVAKNKKLLFCTVLILIIIGSIASSAWLGMPKNSTLAGVAYVDKPIDGGTLTIYDLSGNKLFETQNATSQNGLFVANVVWAWMWGIPQEFKVTITGGTINGASFDGTLTRYIQNYDQKTFYTINAITTLAAVYKDNNPSLSYATVEQNVTSFLDIPSTTTLTAVIDNAYSSRLFFDSETFAEEATANAGFNTFINALAVELGEGKTHPFPGETLVSAEEGGMFAWTAGALGEGAVCYFEEMAIGWVMGKLGYKSPEEKENEKIMKQLEAMSEKLDEINGKLDQVIADLAQISSKLSAIQIAIKNMQIELEKFISEQNSYDPMAKIDNAFSDLSIYSKCAPGEVSNATIDEWAASVLDSTNGIAYAINLLDKFNMGNVIDNEDGLIQIFTNQLNTQFYSQTKVNYGREFRDNINLLYQSLTDYFQKVLYYELRGLILVSEAHHARNETMPVKLYIDNFWRPMIQNQIKTYLSMVERIVIVQGDFLEFPNMGQIPEDLRFETFYKNNYGHVPPSIAEILPDADQYADQLLNGTGRFTLRVLYGTMTYPNLNPADPKPILQNMDTGKQYKVAGELKSVKVIRANNEDLVIYYRTYELGALPVGKYKIASPTTIIADHDQTGWVNDPSLEIYEYWDFGEAMRISIDGLLPDWGGIMPHIGSIQVTKIGNATYGYWGGTWWDKSIDHGFR